MKLTNDEAIAIKRKRGEHDLSVHELAQQTGVSQWTLIDIFKHGQRNVTSPTFKGLNDWLVKTVNQDMEKQDQIAIGDFMKSRKRTENKNGK